MFSSIKAFYKTLQLFIVDFIVQFFQILVQIKNLMLLQTDELWKDKNFMKEILKMKFHGIGLHFKNINRMLQKFVVDFEL